MEQQRLDSGMAKLTIATAARGLGEAFWINASDLDAVVTQVLAHLPHVNDVVHVTAREQYLPNGVATVGGYPTGRDHAKDDEIARRRHMTFRKDGV